MHLNLTKSLALLFFLLARSTLFGAYLSRPELTDYNFANAVICTQNSLKIKFDYENFTNGNVFTVQISSATGSFTNPTTLIGSLNVSGSQQNVFFIVTFPSGIPEGNGYRLRVRGTSPLTYSNQVNEYPFTLSNATPSDPSYYPTGFWRGYVYTWTPSTTGTIADASSEDLFNPNQYIGYIAEDSLMFDYNWGNTGMAPGNLPDTARVCGGYRDNFCIRMRRKITFQNGYYVFGGGADDGFRLSIDGGNTWLISDWSDHTYRGSMQNNGCGVQMTAGEREVVCEFYEHTIDARFRCIIMKTGDPAIDPISITDPANGATLCSGATPFQMAANPPGAWQWSGPGVSSSGMLNPAVGGLGPRTITYQTGYSAFGQNCVKTTSISVNIIQGVSAQFSGLLSWYCINGSASTLVPQNSGGIFNGPGVTGSIFSPQTAGVGTHTIRYTTSGAGSCQDVVEKTTTVYALPDASFAPLPDSICVGSGNITLVPAVTGGSFIGQGVILPNQFSPAILLPSNQYQVQYSITQNGCTNQSTQFIYILEKLKTTLSFPQMKTRYCVGDPAFTPVSDPAGQYYLNGQWVQTIDPTALGAGQYSLKAIFEPDTPLSCIDSSSALYAFTIIAPPVPELGPDREVESGQAVTLDPNILPPYTWLVADATFEAGKPIAFIPPGDLTVKVLANDPTATCFASDSVHLTIRSKMEIPNLVLLSGSLANREWRIKGAYPAMVVTLYNRWGEKVYSGDTVGELAWKPKADARTGMYYYLIENKADNRSWSGWLTVMN